MSDFIMDEKVREWVEHNFDIDDDAPDRATQTPVTEPLPKRLEWTSWLPNGYLLYWQTYSIRERVLMISVAFHLNFRIKEFQYELRVLRGEDENEDEDAYDTPDVQGMGE